MNIHKVDSTITIKRIKSLKQTVKELSPCDVQGTVESLVKIQEIGLENILEYFEIKSNANRIRTNRNPK